MLLLWTPALPLICLPASSPRIVTGRRALSSTISPIIGVAKKEVGVAASYFIPVTIRGVEGWSA
jgi:hypothetical protein